MGKDGQGEEVESLVQVKAFYFHFPFCRGRCRYCALHSHRGVPKSRRDEYVRALASRISGLNIHPETVYFGGGTPALADLSPLLDALRPKLDRKTEFTVELHPVDALTPGVLDTLAAGGVNRISIGVQSFDDGVLSDMGRLHTADVARRAIDKTLDRFENTGMDLIVGYPVPGAAPESPPDIPDGIKHCSVYSLTLEEDAEISKSPERLARMPNDDETMDGIREISGRLGKVGLDRYEISSWAAPGYECRHNLSVWRGEDYAGFGEGAHGRLGLSRTQNMFTPEHSRVEVAPDRDFKERTLFRLRLSEGMDLASLPGGEERTELIRFWRRILDSYAAKGLFTRNGTVYSATERGMEVLDSVLVEMA